MRIITPLAFLYVLASCTPESGNHLPKVETGVPHPSAMTASNSLREKDLLREYAGTNRSPELLATPEIKSRLMQVLGPKYSRLVKIVKESKPQVNVIGGQFVLYVNYSHEDREKYLVCFSPNTYAMTAASYIGNAMTIYSRSKDYYPQPDCVRHWMIVSIHEDEYSTSPPPQGNSEFTFTQVQVPRETNK